MQTEQDLRKEFADARKHKGLPPTRLPPGGNGSDNGGMDDLTRRVGTLETKMDKVQETLVSIQVTLARMEEKAATKEELSNVRVEVAEMKGRVAKLPSLAQIAALLAIAGAIFKGLSFIHS